MSWKNASYISTYFSKDTITINKVSVKTKWIYIFKLQSETLIKDHKVSLSINCLFCGILK